MRKAVVAILLVFVAVATAQDLEPGAIFAFSRFFPRWQANCLQLHGRHLGRTR